MPRSGAPRLALLSVAHFTIDAYSSFFTPLLPLLIAKLDLSLTRVGALVALASITSSFSQPLFGWLSDRLHRPWFVALGPLVAAVFMSAIGLAPSFASLAAVLMIGGLGVAAFHPQAAALASALAPRRAVALSLFVTSGMLGFSLGPLLAVAIVGLVGLERLWVAALPGIAVVGFLLSRLSRVEPGGRRGAIPRIAELRPVLSPLALLYVAVVTRSAVSLGFVTFLPVYLNRRGFSVEAGGAILAVYLAVGAIGGLVGGWLADRVGGRRVMILSFAGAIPLFLAFLALPTVSGLACLVAGRFVLQAALSVNVVLGQELSPRHASTISSLLMGAAWGMGALVVGPAGALADAFGLPTALFVLAMLLPVGLACGWALPRPGRTGADVELVPQPLAAEQR